MSVSSVSTIIASLTASTTRAADGDYKTRGVGHEVKDADGDYKPTPKPTVSVASPPAASSSNGVQTALLGLTKGGA